MIKEFIYFLRRKIYGKAAFEKWHKMRKISQKHAKIAHFYSKKQQK